MAAERDIVAYNRRKTSERERLYVEKILDRFTPPKSSPSDDYYAQQNVRYWAGEEGTHKAKIGNEIRGALARDGDWLTETADDIEQIFICEGIPWKRGLNSVRFTQSDHPCAWCVEGATHK